MSRKHDIKVISVDKITSDSVMITLEKMTDHDYISGQYLTLELNINGEQVNRSYSFCSAPYEDNWQVGVKHVTNGKASTYLNESLKAGDVISCLEPMGNFVIPNVDKHKTHFTFFAAGSGITPVYSMIKSLLNEGETCEISLFYGNKTPGKTMFREELERLSASYPNFNIEFICSEAGGEDSLHKGRINFGKTLELLRLHSSDGLDNHAFICGPGDMITSVKNALVDNGYADDKIHTEFFTAPTSENSTHTETAVESADEDSVPFSGTAKILITLDDETHEVTATESGPVILDVALDAGMDAPFSCKGGVCTACRAKVTKGKVEMISNFALTDGELEEGYVLTCQSHPKSDNIELSYDE